MTLQETTISGAYIINTPIYYDNRGYFTETFNQLKFNKIIPGITFIQDNQSHSTKNVLRGLHFQKEPYAQSKLVRCIKGKVFDVAVDLRKNSPTYKKWFGVTLEENSGIQFFIPKGCAHGFVVLTDEATFQYKVDEYWHPEAEDGINAFDPQFNISWAGLSKDDVIMTDKDLNRPNYNE